MVGVGIVSARHQKTSAADFWVANRSIGPRRSRHGQYGGHHARRVRFEQSSTPPPSSSRSASSRLFGPLSWPQMAFGVILRSARSTVRGRGFRACDRGERDLSTWLAQCSEIAAIMPIRREHHNAVVQDVPDYALSRPIRNRSMSTSLPAGVTCSPASSSVPPPSSRLRPSSFPRSVMTYISDESGQYEVYVRPFPSLEGKWQISADGGQEPVWARSGKELFYRKGRRMSAPLTCGSRTRRHHVLGRIGLKALNLTSTHQGRKHPDSVYLPRHAR